MDPMYDTRAAGLVLEQLSQERATQEHSGLQLSELLQNEQWPSCFSVIETGQSPTWRLAVCGEETNMAPEEAIWHVQGIIGKKDLPPFMDKIGSSARARFLRQSVSLLGCNTATFQKSAENIATIYALFTRYVPADKLQPPGIVGEIQDDLSIHVSNRYLTPARGKDGTIPTCVMGPEIDPQGILTKICGTEFYYGEDNVVSYYERIATPGGGYKFIPIAPVKLQIGDIVEAQISFMVIPLRGGEFKITAVLRSLTLLDGQFAQEAMAAKMVKKIQVKAPVVLKHKVGYSAEEEAEARAKMNRMQLDQDEERTET